MDGASEYRDAWRGLRIRVPAGWQVRRSGAGLFLHDQAGRQTVLVQPRPGAGDTEQLALDLQAWLRRLDPRARLEPGPAAPQGARFCTATLLAPSGEEAVGVFALQASAGAGLISGFVVPAVDYDAASALAVGALASLAAAPPEARLAWREPGEGACTALVPAGWQAEGVVHRDRGAGLPAIEFRAWSGDGLLARASSGGKLFIEPGLLAGLLGGLSGGLVGRGRFVDAAAYAEGQLLPALCREAPHARIEAVLPRPDLIPSGAAQEAAASGVSVEEVLRGQPTAADVFFALERHGRAERGMWRVLTMRVPEPLAHGLPLWMALVPYTYSGPTGSLPAWEPVLEGVCLSFQVDGQWMERQTAQLAMQAGRAGAEPSSGTDASLLEEAESLWGALRGRALAAHERPFVAQPRPTEASATLAALYEAGVWRQALEPIRKTVE
jgi:hypothetical protein